MDDRIRRFFPLVAAAALCASSCGPTAESSFRATPAELFFGAKVGETDRKVTLVEGGCETPVVSWFITPCRMTLEFSIEGDHASSFSFSLESSAEFTANREGNRATFLDRESVNVAVTFRPQQTGLLSATVLARIDGDAADHPLQVRLVANGL